MENERLVKDHFQDLLLSSIYGSIPERGMLVFKGGTAIRKIYGMDRYSDDLDFTLDRSKLTVPSENFVYSLRDNSVATLAPLYDTRMHVHRGKNDSFTIDAMLRDNLRNSAKIRVEITVGRVYRPILEKRVITVDASYFASVMSIEEIISEKIRAVYTRRNIENIARDAVDIAFLAGRGHKLDLKLANEKLEELKHRPFSQESFSRRLSLVTERMWQQDLSGIMKVIPDRADVMGQVNRFINGR